MFQFVFVCTCVDAFNQCTKELVHSKGNHDCRSLTQRISHLTMADEGGADDEAKLLEPYMGAMRITIHVKGDFERAVRIVIDPKSDTWEGFLKEALGKLKVKTDVYSIMRASTKTTITSIAQIRYLTPRHVADVFDDGVTRSGRVGWVTVAVHVQLPVFGALTVSRAVSQTERPAHRRPSVLRSESDSIDGVTPVHRHD